MGAACCVAAKGRTVTNGSPGDNLQRHTHYSPSWSFRWDNRGRVAGEETHSNWANDEVCGENRMGVKFGAAVEAAFASEEGSPLDGFRSSNTWRKSAHSEGNSGTLRLQSSDQAIPQNIPEINESTDSPSISYSPPLKLSPSIPSLSSKSASPLSSRNHNLLFPPNSSTPSRWHYHRSSPRHPLFRQVSDSRITKSPSFSISEEPAAPSWGNDSTRGSQGGSSDSWSMPTRRERWSFDSEGSGFSRDRFGRFSGPHSGPTSLDLQTCGICTQLLTERSSQKLMIFSNELAVVSVLTCGHVYHSDCLEYMTPEVEKYDPACPVCTFGEKRALKMMSEKDSSKARKKSRKVRVVDSDLSGEIVFDRSRSGSTRKPFLRRHFSFGVKMNRQLTDRQSNPRKGFFWARSSME
ncbi:RING/U-box superfamily protein [Striga asiatica]|uniref:RING/U-box superfamily protein n=1 Tax=Striga asiatica TaxID=4170 RepID=A0A5A7QZ45_STRAF|nr:RING/U-box superfamily protein [Striga asiatica]